MSVVFDGDFPCTSCSLCCRNVERIRTESLNWPKDSVLYVAAASFPYSWDDSGCCDMLKDNLCSVYASRPLLCNVKEISKYLAEELNSDVRTMYALNASACNNLITNYDLDPQFMIDLDQFK